MASTRQQQLLLLLGIANIHSKRKTVYKQKHRKRFWIQSPNLFRASNGGYNSVLEFYKKDTAHFHLYKNTLRVTPECFTKILEYIRPYITKQNTLFRKSISAEERLTITLLYLATGDSIKLIAMFFRIGISTARGIIYETCSAIWKNMQSTYLRTP